MLPYRRDIRKHPNVDDGVSEAGEEHGEVAHVHRAQPPLGVLGALQTLALLQILHLLLLVLLLVRTLAPVCRHGGAGAETGDSCRRNVRVKSDLQPIVIIR